MYTNIPLYCSYWGETGYLVTFPDAIETYFEISLFSKNGKEIFFGRAAYLLKVQAVGIIQRSRVFRRWFILYDKFLIHSLKHASFV